MIKSFRGKATVAAWEGVRLKGVPSDLLAVTRRKLVQLNRATTLGDLRAPPSNNLEALRGDRAGQHSIRVNDGFRLCFIGRDGDAHEVEFTDYH